MPSYLLKVTKFLGKISQLEFLVMTEKKNIFAYKVFLSLNISYFSLFFIGKLQLFLEKSHPPLSQKTPSKSCGPVKTLFLKIWLEA